MSALPMSAVPVTAVPVSAVRSLTDQNFSHSARENKMLLNIELSRERIRDMERQFIDRHVIVPVHRDRRSRRSISVMVTRFGRVLTYRRV